MDLKAGKLENKRRDIKRELERLEEQIVYNTDQLTSMDKEISILDPASEKAKNLMRNRKYFSDPLPKFEKEISNLKSNLKSVDNEKKKMNDEKIKEGELKIEELEKKKIEFRDNLANLGENINALNDFLNELKEEREFLERECLDLDK